MISRISQVLYRVCLFLYPREFRQDYGELMQLVFEEACHEAQSDSIWAWMNLWQKTFFDLAKSIYHEHRTNLMTEKIHGYEINATIGIGALATLYRAYDPSIVSQVALKVMDKKADMSLLPHIEREAQVHQQLNHPNIPHCYGVKETEDSICIVMEYINGKTLLEILEERNKPFSRQDVINWGLIACDVLTYLHNQGYIYRDMKPGNLMLTAENELYIIDYGITVFSEGDGVAIGTIGYAPPEQYKGNVSLQSDIYALGATLHQLLTNRDPRHHEAHSFDEVLPSSYNSDISSGLEAVLIQALKKDANERFTSAEAMKQALLTA